MEARRALSGWLREDVRQSYLLPSNMVYAVILHYPCSRYLWYSSMLSPSLCGRRDRLNLGWCSNMQTLSPGHIHCLLNHWLTLQIPCSFHSHELSGYWYPWQGKKCWFNSLSCDFIRREVREKYGEVRWRQSFPFPQYPETNLLPVVLQVTCQLCSCAIPAHPSTRQQ